jgi:lysophospholipase
MEAAPFHSDLAEGPGGGRANWLTAHDGIRIRVGHWPGKNAGTVFLFPGRCEYIEKYGLTALEIVQRGFHAIAVDWRGQGLSDRLLSDPNVGHVRRFSDFQYDVAAAVEFADRSGLPRPYHLIAHSMGGCIGLRSLIDADHFSSAAFSAPMWGVAIAPSLQTAAHVLPLMASRLGLGARRTPTTGGASYLVEASFDGNLLTRDRDMWDYMVRQAKQVEQFRLGGPSLTWLAEALAETRALMRAPRPGVAAHASVGDQEKIVEPSAVEAVMADWPDGTFTWIPAAEHEILMEIPPVREGFLNRAFETFAGRSAA